MDCVWYHRHNAFVPAVKQLLIKHDRRLYTAATHLMHSTLVWRAHVSDLIERPPINLKAHGLKSS